MLVTQPKTRKQRSVVQLVESLSDRDTARVAMGELKAMQMDALPQLIVALGHRNRRVRHQVIAIIRRLGSQATTRPCFEASTPTLSFLCGPRVSTSSSQKNQWKRC